MNTRQQTNSRRQDVEQYSLLVTKTAPKLEKASLAAKVQFLKDWEVYEDDIDAHCRRTGDTVAGATPSKRVEGRKFRAI